jgi:MFS family permease
MLLVGVTYGIQPSAGSSMSWETPRVLGLLLGGVAALALFIFIEKHVAEPMFKLSLFRIRSFTAGNIASLLSSITRGGLGFMMSIWLQGIWLPLHGYSFEITPLWAGIFMLPQSFGFLITGPISGFLSDRFGARKFATGGMILSAIGFALLLTLPVNFLYWQFALVLLLLGISMGLFGSPNNAAIMNSVPAASRGVGSGMRSAFLNAGMPLSNAVFFSLMTIGLSATLPSAMLNGLTQAGIPPASATELSKLPPFGYLTAALMGYNPLGTRLGPEVLNSLPSSTAAQLTSRSYFPQLISASFQHALSMVLIFCIVISLIAAVASWVRGERYVYEEKEREVKTLEMGSSEERSTIPDSMKR